MFHVELGKRKKKQKAKSMSQGSKLLGEETKPIPGLYRMRHDESHGSIGDNH